VQSRAPSPHLPSAAARAQPDRSSCPSHMARGDPARHSANSQGKRRRQKLVVLNGSLLTFRTCVSCADAANGCPCVRGNSRADCTGLARVHLAHTFQRLEQSAQKQVLETGRLLPGMQSRRGGRGLSSGGAWCGVEQGEPSSEARELLRGRTLRLDGREPLRKILVGTWRWQRRYQTGATRTRRCSRRCACMVAL